MVSRPSASTAPSSKKKRIASARGPEEIGVGGGLVGGGEDGAELTGLKGLDQLGGAGQEAVAERGGDEARERRKPSRRKRASCSSLRVRSMAAKVAPAGPRPARLPTAGARAWGRAFGKSVDRRPGMGENAPSFRCPRPRGEVAKWLGNGLQNRYTRVRIPSSPPHSARRSSIEIEVAQSPRSLRRDDDARRAGRRSTKRPAAQARDAHRTA